MKIKYRLLKIGVCMVLFIVMMNFSTKQYHKEQVQKIDIEIKESDSIRFITSENVEKWVDETCNGKEKIVEYIDVPAIESKIKEIPYTKNCNVFLNPKGELSITLQQKTPIARIHHAKGDYYITQEADSIPFSSQFSYPCMLVSGKITSEEHIDIVTLVQYITMDNLLKNHIVGIHKEGDKSFILLVNQDDYYIEFGDLQRIPEKFISLKAFYSQYLNHVGLNTYRKISLKYDNQIVATKK